jgi:hypothetical protein
MKDLKMSFTEVNNLFKQKQKYENLIKEYSKKGPVYYDEFLQMNVLTAEMVENFERTLNLIKETLIKGGYVL